jgi:accessory gene regulator protein AgrB
MTDLNKLSIFCVILSIVMFAFGAFVERKDLWQDWVPWKKK